MTVYQPYTTQFDRVVNATALPAVPLLKKFGHWISLKKHSKLVDRTQTEVVGFLEGLPPDRIQALRSIAQNTAATVLVDHSGSLKGHGIQEIALCVVYTLLFLFDKLGIRHEVSGFTTRSWRGGDSRELWIKNNRPEKPGRLCDLLHIIYKSHDSDEKTHFQLILSNLLRPDLLKENVDGEAIEWAASRLAGRAEQNKILFHVSDGAPVDDSTLHDNYGDYLVDHLKSVIKALEEDGKISLYGIGLHFGVNEFFPHSLNVDSASGAARLVCKYIVGRLVETSCSEVGESSSGSTILN
jgi:cobaltochelatase CobT